MASFASSATTCGARKHAWNKIIKLKLNNVLVLHLFLQKAGNARPCQLYKLYSYMLTSGYACLYNYRWGGGYTKCDDKWKTS